MKRQKWRDDPIPDRVSIERDSPFYHQNAPRMGIKFEGKVIFNVIEYCISENWVRRFVTDGFGNPKKERGKFVATRVYGKVEPYWR